jgi:hypothetical protein
MRRFTILSLMGLIVGVAIAVAALRNADDYWAGGLMLATVLLLGMATLGAFYHSGRRRASRVGFVVFCGGYFALAFLGLSDRNLAKLPTTWLLLFVHERVAPPQTYSVTFTTPATGPGTILLSNVSPGPVTGAFTTATTSQISVAGAVNANRSARWTAMLPGAANYEAFSAVGHCEFALAAGLLGIVIARRYQARLTSQSRLL